MNLILWSQLSIVAPFAAGVFAWPRFTLPWRILTVFFGISVLTEAAASALKTLAQNNLVLLHFFTLFEFYAFFSWIYFIIPHSKRKSGIYFGIGFIFTILAVLEMVNQGIQSYNSMTKGIESVLLILGSIYYFAIDGNEIGTKSKRSHLWMFIGIFLYFGTQIFNFSMMNDFIRNNRDLAVMMKMFHATVNIVANLCFAISLLLRRKYI